MDISGPISGREIIPKHALCRICKMPVPVGVFRRVDVPLSTPFEAGWRCQRGHVVALADFYNVIDSSTREMVHAFRPRDARVSVGGLSEEDALRLLDAAQDVIAGRDQSGAFAAALAAAPEPLRTLRPKDRKMSAQTWIGLAAVVSSTVFGVLQLSLPDGHATDEQLVQVITEIIDRLPADDPYREVMDDTAP
jgi:hypothetical protein